MIRTYQYLILICQAVLICSIAAEDKITGDERKIRDFEFQGMRFGTSGTEFLRRFPNAQFDKKNSDQKKKIHVLTLEGIAGTDLVEASFIDEELYDVTFYYVAERINKIGGYMTVVEKIFIKYGPSSPASKRENVDNPALISSRFWNFSAVDRMIEVKVGKEAMKVSFTDTERYSKMIERKKRAANLGF